MGLGFETNILSSKDMGASFESDPIYVSEKSRYCIQAVFNDATSPVGTISLETSINGDTWTELPDSPYGITEAGDRMYSVSDANYLMARIKYVRTSGSGTMNIYANVKD